VLLFLYTWLISNSQSFSDFCIWKGMPRFYFLYGYSYTKQHLSNSKQPEKMQKVLFRGRLLYLWKSSFCSSAFKTIINPSVHKKQGSGKANQLYSTDVASENCSQFFNVRKEDLAFVTQYLGGQKSRPFLLLLTSRRVECSPHLAKLNPL